MTVTQQSPSELVAVMGPASATAEVRMPPTFSSIEKERTYRKQQLAAGFRLFGRFGFSEGVAGHITVRDPENPTWFWVNPFGMSFRHITASDLVLVDHEGNVVAGNSAVNRAAFVIHSEVHRARPDVIAAAHSHSVHGKSFSTLGRTLDPITQDACAFFNDHVLYAEHNGLVNEVDEGRAIATALGPHKAAILQNHGLLTVGESVAEAVWWFITMERSCQAQLLAMAAGTPLHISDEVAAHNHTMLGSHFAGWFQAQPLFDEILRDQPDLLN